MFLTSPLSFAFVNLKPVVPGHVLVSSKRVVPRFTELTGEEVQDIWSLAQKVGSVIEEHFEATSLTFAIQDGPAAGQTVPHVHIHILPRRVGDFENNDEIYDAIDTASSEFLTTATQSHHQEETQHKGKKSAAGEPLDLDKERHPRTPEEMAAEASVLRAKFSA